MRNRPLGPINTQRVVSLTQAKGIRIVMSGEKMRSTHGTRKIDPVGGCGNLVIGANFSASTVISVLYRRSRSRSTARKWPPRQQWLVLWSLLCVPAFLKLSTKPLRVVTSVRTPGFWTARLTATGTTMVVELLSIWSHHLSRLHNKNTRTT